MKLKVLLAFFILGALDAAAFAPLADDYPVLFAEDFEGYGSTRALQKVFTPWKEGAQVEVALNTTAAKPGANSMRVMVLAPNAENKSEFGSVYRNLPLGKRNWNGASAVRLWVSNPGQDAFYLSFNFKEQANEYWAAATEGTFFLQGADGAQLQQDIWYGNLPVPAGWQGVLIVPFDSFAVPEWNTARGNEKMDLGRVESFGLAVSTGGAYPAEIILDDLQVIAAPAFARLLVHGPASVQIPDSGEHREFYAAGVIEAPGATLKPVTPVWSLEQAAGSAVQIDAQGALTVPAGTPPQTIVLVAAYLSARAPVAVKYPVTLGSSQSAPAAPQAPAAPAQAPADAPQQPKLSAFEAWAYGNRPTFVAAALGSVAIFVLALSFFQRRLK